MSVSGNEALLGEALHDALIAFTGCVGEALDGICSYGLTIGATYVPFDPDEDTTCAEGEAICSQAWVRVMSVHPVYGGNSFGGDDCGAVFNLSLEVGVTRCLDIPPEGAAPTESDVLVAALQAMTDMNAIYCAATGCEAFDTVKAGQWSPSGPMGGDYGGTWTFDVEL